MRRTVLVGAGLTAAFVAATSSATTVKPALRVVGAEPLVVAGTGFAPREQVVVSALTSLGMRTARTHAGATGSFRVLVGTFSQPCGRPFAVRARGLVSSRVAVARLAPTPCVPPPLK